MPARITSILPAALAVLLWVGSAAATTYTYDRLHRLTRVVFDDGHKIIYTYDAVGNRTHLSSFRPGDVNGDGLVNAADVNQFVAVLLGSDTNPLHVLAADVDNSSVVDGDDVRVFVTALLTV